MMYLSVHVSLYVVYISPISIFSYALSVYTQGINNHDVPLGLCSMVALLNDGN